MQLSFFARGQMSNGGIKTFIDAKHAIAHNKVMVIDGYMNISFPQTTFREANSFVRDTLTGGGVGNATERPHSGN
jgi:hypothetical protein